MKITIAFKDSNAAFEDNGTNEYGHIMTQAMAHADDQETGTFPLMDSNGNKVGTVKLENE